MRITYLYLKNFLHIYTGLNKTEIELDFRKNDKVINVIIGKMGSCKSVILGHLQPFYNFGTLDSRNQDGIILDHENGEKRICYQDNKNEYELVHKYIWKNDKHTVKSYIKKNGIELNPNGNVTSFRSIVEVELGVEPTDLSMIRLGTNVTNLIDMSAAERKSYMASRLKDTEIYGVLYKKLNEEMRLLNAKAAILSGKITTLTKGSIEDMQEEKAMLAESLLQLQDQLNQILKEIGGIEVQLREIFKGDSVQDFRKKITLYTEEMHRLEHEIDVSEREIHDVQSRFRSISEISESLGAVKNRISQNQETLGKMEKEYYLKGGELGKLQEKRLISRNKEQIQNMKKTYMELIEMLENMETELSKFKCKYATPQLRALLSQLNMINELISDIALYNRESVHLLITKNGNVLRDASNQIDALNRKKTKLHRILGNLQFSDHYEPTSILYFPPNCPTEDCPYYRTHPVTIKKSNCGKIYDEKIAQLKLEIDHCDQEIEKLSEYPIVFSKIQNLREMWPSITSQLSDIGALKIGSLVKVFSSIFNQKWYDYDKVVDTLNLSVKRDKYYELNQRAQAMRAELDAISRDGLDDIDNRIDALEKEIDQIATTLSETEEDQKRLQQQKISLEASYLTLSKLDDEIKEVSNKKRNGDLLEEKIIDMENGLQKSSDLQRLLSDKKIRQKTLSATIEEHQNKIDRLNAALNDISFSQKEFIEVQESQSYLKDIVEAVSSNKGIPLVYVKLFLNQCKDMVNDLISDVFGDSIEILDFDINETDFKIPYAINGSPVKDIASASQGQRSIISLALSFALVQQSLTRYNIMLLDEMDGPLYKDDRDKFISILLKQIQAIRAEQIFIISHNNTFDGQNVNIIMTTDEHVDKSHQVSIMHV